MSVNGTRPHPRGLDDLPDELLIQIISLLPQPRDLSALCLVSRRLNRLADPVLHRSISFSHPDHHRHFSASLSTRPRRGSLVYDVRLQYPEGNLADSMQWLKNSYTRIDNFSHAISTMSNLENLDIAVPEELLHGIGTLFNGPFDLACLKTCSLFYQRDDGGYWDLQENIHIFSHPSLETLTIRRAKLDARGFSALEQPEETPLKTLHLIECDISDDGLSDILMFPEALKEIKITQLPIPNPPLEESAEDIEDYILAVQSAKHSLEKIEIDFPTLTAENPLKLRRFDHLKYLSLRCFQLFGQSRLHSVGMPPEIETLRFLGPIDDNADASSDGDDEGLVELLCYTIRQMDVLARHLKQLVVHAGERGVPQRVVDACLEQKEHFELVIR